MNGMGSSMMVKVGYHPLDIYLGQYILQFLVKQLDFAPVESKNEGVKRRKIPKVIEMSRKGSGIMVKVGYYPFDIYLSQYILPFLVKLLDFAPIGSKPKALDPLKRGQILKIIELSHKASGLMVKVGYHPLHIYLGQYILPFLVNQLDFAPIGSKNEGT